MIDDFISVLIAIASISAAIVAILGGFIFSKYIPNLTQHKSLKNRQDEIKDKLGMLKTDLEKCEALDKELFPLSFLYDNAEIFTQKLSKGKTIKKLMDMFNMGRYNYQPDKMYRYFDFAYIIWRDFQSLSKEEMEDADVDIIPFAIKKKYQENDCKYSICVALCPVFKEFCYSNYYGESLYLSPYASVTDKFNENKKILEDKMGQKKKLDDEEGRIKWELDSIGEPGGMKIGLALFLLYAGCCIIFPLAYVVFASVYRRCVEIVIIVIFSIFLLLTFVYLACLLSRRFWDSNSDKKSTRGGQWKNDSKL